MLIFHHTTNASLSLALMPGHIFYDAASTGPPTFGTFVVLSFFLSFPSQTLSSRLVLVPNPKEMGLRAVRKGENLEKFAIKIQEPDANSYGEWGKLEQSLCSRLVFLVIF